MPARETMSVEQCNCFTVRRAARQITRLYDEHLQSTGLRITQFLTLATINELKSVAINELAERLDIERTAMGKMASSLERDGCVKISQSPADGRNRILELTSEGAALLRRAHPLWIGAQREFARLNGAERVGAIRQNLADMAIGGGVARTPD